MARSISRHGGRLFRSPFAVVLLVWGFLFLILSVAIVYDPQAGYDVYQGQIAPGHERRGCDKKIEAVELFSAGEDPVIPLRAPAVKAPTRRHKIAERRRARRL